MSNIPALTGKEIICGTISLSTIASFLPPVINISGDNYL